MPDLPDARLTIGMLAERSGCHVPTIRYYEEIGLLPKAMRRPNGHRVYSTADLARLIFIRRSRDFGFSIEQIRDLIALSSDPARDCVEARDVAQMHLDAVRLKLVELQALEQGLTDLVGACTQRCVGGGMSACTIFSGLTSQDTKPDRAGQCCG
jgi:DNA-binding transcriptional MerR regulator